MHGAKPWQFVVLGLGVIALIFVAVFSLSGDSRDVKLASTITLADVATGALYEVDVSRAGVFFPMTNPDTKTPTLFPVAKDEESNTWRIDGQFVGALRGMTKEQTAAVTDRRAGTITATGDAPRRIAVPAPDA